MRPGGVRVESRVDWIGLLSAAERCLGRHELKLESRRGQYVMRLWVGKL